MIVINQKFLGTHFELTGTSCLYLVKVANIYKSVALTKCLTEIVVYMYPNPRDQLSNVIWVRYIECKVRVRYVVHARIQKVLSEGVQL